MPGINVSVNTIMSDGLKTLSIGIKMFYLKVSEFFRFLHASIATATSGVNNNKVLASIPSYSSVNHLRESLKFRPIRIFMLKIHLLGFFILHFESKYTCVELKANCTQKFRGK